MSDNERDQREYEIVTRDGHYDFVRDFDLAVQIRNTLLVNNPDMMAGEIKVYEVIDGGPGPQVLPVREKQS